MTETNDQLALLRRLRKEGQISAAEYDKLTRGIIPSGPPVATVAEADDVTPDFAVPESLDETVEETSPEDEAAMKGLRNVATAGVLLVVGIIAVAVFSAIGGASQPVAAQAPVVTAAPVDPYPAVPGSLGIHIDEITEMWNTVDSPPKVTKGLTRYNESGEYDTFLYRFDESARLAGAYDPMTKSVYAVLVADRLDGSSVANLYLHLCQLVAPYSPECIESYHEKGLAGAALADYTDVAHETEWTLGENRWRLEIEGNVVTIRVFAPDA